MLKLFTDKLGTDVNGKSYFELGEINIGEDWAGRTWELSFGQINIKRLNGWFQLYFFPLNEEEKQVKN